MAWSVGESYWAFLGSTTVLGLGMAISVAPLTTVVLNAVPAHETGIASAINNADASLANLLAVAIFGMLALGFYDRAIDRHLQGTTISAETRLTVETARGQFIVPQAAPATAAGAEQVAAQAMIKASLGDSIQKVMMLAALLALAAAASGALLPRTVRPQEP